MIINVRTLKRVGIVILDCILGAIGVIIALPSPFFGGLFGNLVESLIGCTILLWAEFHLANCVFKWIKKEEAKK